MARLLLPILAPGACQVGLVFDHHHRQHHPDHLHRHFHHNWTILNISVCLPSWPSFDQIYPFLHAVPRQGDHYRHHNQHELFLRCIANYIWSPTPSPCCGCQRCCFSSFIFHFFSDAAEGKIVVMQSSLGCWPPSSWRARWLPSSPYCGYQRCCLSLSIPLFSLISFQCRSQAVIESSIGCLPLSLLSPSSSSTWWAHPTTGSTWTTTRSPPSPLHGWRNPSTRRFDALQSSFYFNQASKWWLWWLVNGNVITVAVEW